MSHLEHVAKNAEDTVETLVFVTLSRLPGDTSHQFGQNDQVDDQRGGKERVLANVEKTDCLVATKEDLGVVFIEGTLVITHGGHVLDNNGVVGVLILVVEDVIGSDHVIHDVGFGDLLGAELLLGAQVLAIVVTKVVVTGDGRKFDTSVDQEINKGRLHLGLARLEVITANESIVLLSELNGTRNEGVLWGAIDKRGVLENGSNCENSGWSNFQVALLDRFDQVVSSVVDIGDNVSISLSVGGPHDNNLV